jgi:sterol desaturase/sphingolipid hydroxylase (fatty acid hydroxylase superfamily)
VSEQALNPAELSQGGERRTSTKSWNDVFWTLVQPVVALGAPLLVATTLLADVWGEADRKLFALVMIFLPIPLFVFAERRWGREDWKLKPSELAEDGFWLAMGAFLWGPLVSDLYRTPVSEGFRAIRDRAMLEISLEPTTVFGLFGAVIFIDICKAFPYYWLHRVQHESLFWWRMHGTHHHITKMSFLRGARTHPFEYLALSLGSLTVMAFMGASDEVLAVSAAFGMWNGKFNHSNLPLKSLPVYDWVFATAPQHHVHHALDRRQSDSNYGCQIILWDRIFGTYCGDTSSQVGQIGAGKAVPLSIKEQLMLAFYPNKRLVDL